ncbi:MAG TPA: peptidoglycan DD-metalloendopeptidase family protein [Ferruginibacter sp.]|nr:peptidoglycan DD-metalloendopeptidase family protein [Ferruginibacter sp.]
MITELENALIKNAADFHPVIKFDAGTDQLVRFDLTEANRGLTAEIVADTALFTAYVDARLKNTGAKFGIGGYNENRTIYRRSKLFSGEEERTLHLGIDIWGPAGTPVYAAFGGMVHSFAFNNDFGDYGATIILLHQLETVAFYTLYGHLSLKDISVLKQGAYITRGEVIGHFGEPNENGNWPPHLHFQVIHDIELKEGDYPGVCSLSEKAKYLKNCPDPDLILQMMRLAKV